jgi:hypothetical protein
MPEKYRTIVLIGMPGSGKGTQGSALGRLPGFHYFSSGEMFRSLDRATGVGRAGVMLPIARGMIQAIGLKRGTNVGKAIFLSLRGRFLAAAFLVLGLAALVLLLLLAGLLLFGGGQHGPGRHTSTASALAA